MQDLVNDLVNGKLSRRGFLAGMAAASYSAAAANSALAAVESFIPGSELPEGYVRQVTGTGGDVMLAQILETGTRYLFCSNGSGLGPICDALVDQPGLQLIQATHEGQVVAIADGYAKATGKPAFGMYSRVGLPHSTSNMYNAMKDRTPLVLMSDSADSDVEGTDSHEDLNNWEESVSHYTKWRWAGRNPDRLAEWVRKAYKVAGVLPGGPTHLRVPRDSMQARTTATVYSREALHVPMNLRPSPSEVERAAKVLLNASSPLLEVGPEVSQCNARAKMVELAELLAIPVIQHRSFYCDFPNTHPLWIGEEEQVVAWQRQYVQPIDLYLNFGARTRQNGFASGVPEVHASVDAESIGRNAPLVAALVGHLDEIAGSLIDAIKDMTTPSQLQKITEERRQKCAAHTRSLLAARMEAGRSSKGSPVPWPRLMWELRQQLEKDAVVVEETGTEYKALGLFPYGDDAMTKIGRTEGRALGWGVGASAGVKLALPNRQVISLQGDGGFLFGQTDSLWTMARYDVPVMTVVLNNHCYEETRWSMMGRGGARSRMGAANRDYLSYLGNPDVDFTKLASAYNIPGAVVTDSDELAGAIRRGLRTLAEGRPFMLDVHTRTLGVGAELTDYQKFSLAQQRTRKV